MVLKSCHHGENTEHGDFIKLSLPVYFAFSVIKAL